MIQIIAGEKGKGKTKHLIKMANESVKGVKGNIIYLDKSNKHMYELDYKIRIINVKDYNLESSDAFLGFINGVISQDHDIDIVYVDSIFKIGHFGATESQQILDILNEIAEKYEVRFVLSFSCNANDLPDEVKPLVALAL